MDVKERMRFNDLSLDIGSGYETNEAANASMEESTYLAESQCTNTFDI